MPFSDLQHRASLLILGYLKQELSPAEKKELDQWLAASPQHQQLFDELVSEDRLPGEIAELEGLKSRIAGKIFAEIPQAKPVLPLYRRTFFRVAAAAAILIIVLTGSYFLFVERKSPGMEKPGLAGKDTDVPSPQTNRATLLLADGRTIFLDSALDGELAASGNIKLVKLGDGQIAYQAVTGEKPAGMEYNTLTNPRGSKVIDIKLADGSHVWLNAGSSVTYPIAFAGNERKVSMNGEAYFEISHDADRPFYVSKGEMQVKVLGTKFNVNAYDDEADSKVTLLEGSVEVKIQKSKVKIKPGQQVAINSEQLTVNNNVDTEEVMAWKNGLFNFNNAGLETVLKQLSRWYDVNVKYQGPLPHREFGGKIQRELSLSEVLKLLEKNNIHFKIEGKNIIVQQ